MHVNHLADSTNVVRRAVPRGALLRGMAGLAALGPALSVTAFAPQAAGGSVDRVLARMTVAQKIGQLLMVSVRGAAADAAMLALVRDTAVGGIILYGNNIVSGAQVRTLITGLQRHARIPLLISVDEEGGLVNRLTAADGVRQLLSPAAYGRIGSATRVNRDARATGADLRALGITINFAPEMDVLTDPTSPIGTRSYGSDPALVARLGTAAITGYQAAGIAATAKHFLGLGGVSIDAHLGLPVVRRTLAELQRVELVPMRAAMGAGVAALMVTHVVLPALDPSGTPASISYPIVSGYIRQRMGFTGLIVSDSLYMDAIRARMTVPNAAVSAIAAGCDIALIGDNRPIYGEMIRETIAAVERAIAQGEIATAQLDGTVRRVLSLKQRLGLLASG